ncbi:hypothetical protein AXA44_45180 [Rhodococcus sp. SC4]|nr:hypothetical protein AXA44_45180 [Rhodococcus sp. SC4]
MAKISGTELAVEIARDAVQLFGGLGFTRLVWATEEIVPIEAISRASKIGEIYEGANEIQRWIISRMILGEDTSG